MKRRMMRRFIRWLEWWRSVEVWSVCWTGSQVSKTSNRVDTFSLWVPLTHRIQQIEDWALRWRKILIKKNSITVQVLLKLFSFCVKVKINRQQLVKPEMNTLNVMLGTLNLVSNIISVMSEILVNECAKWDTLLCSRHWWQSRRARTVVEHL